MKRNLLILVIVGLVLSALTLFVYRHHAAQEAARQALRAEQAAELAQARKQSRPASRPASQASQVRPTRGKATQDPQARQALARVGADPRANEVWAMAINNPDLPPNERKDLIEDLNEDGFADPRNLTAEDLPLILTRIEIVEQLAPAAIDDVNAAAFQEAYKDLVNMRDRLLHK
jgi:hypothetical protein